MNRNRRVREQARSCCGRINEDDGIDPHELFKSDRICRKQNRKALQLCRQVADTLGLVLSGDFDDELLHNLQVVSVAPAPDASQLAVTLRADIGDSNVQVQDIVNRLNRVHGRLRSEVAAAITRKRTPRLIFHVIRQQTSPSSGGVGVGAVDSSSHSVIKASDA